MKLKERIHHFLHNEKLKHKLYVIIFESDTPSGKLFDVILIGCILASVLFSPSQEIHFQFLRYRGPAGYPAALYRFTVSGSTLSAYHPRIPADTGISCL